MYDGDKTRGAVDIEGEFMRGVPSLAHDVPNEGSVSREPLESTYRNNELEGMVASAL